MVCRTMRQRFRVTGGMPVKGVVRPAGNKNAALPMLAATVLTDGPCEVVNVPRIRDVVAFLDLLEYLGASVDWTETNTVTVDPSD